MTQVSHVVSILIFISVGVPSEQSGPDDDPDKDNDDSFPIALVAGVVAGFLVLIVVIVIVVYVVMKKRGAGGAKEAAVKYEVKEGPAVEGHVNTVWEQLFSYVSYNCFILCSVLP